jgi:hypothetical protein
MAKGRKETTSTEEKWQQLLREAQKEFTATFIGLNHEDRIHPERLLKFERAMYRLGGPRKVAIAITIIARAEAKRFLSSPQISRNWEIVASLFEWLINELP